jgi:hypothetical protein
MAGDEYEGAILCCELAAEFQKRQQAVVDLPDLGEEVQDFEWAAKVR